MVKIRARVRLSVRIIVRVKVDVRVKVRVRMKVECRLEGLSVDWTKLESRKNYFRSAFVSNILQIFFEQLTFLKKPWF